MKPAIGTIGQRIRQHEGELFQTIRGKRFTYVITTDGNMRVITTDGSMRVGASYHVSWSKFDHALSYVPCDGPKALPHPRRPGKMRHGASYIWAVLHDPRIRRNDY